MGELISDLPLDRMYRIWKNWKAGKPISGLWDGLDSNRLHGVTHIRGGHFTGVSLNGGDSLRRQAITLIHEMIHRFTYKRWNQDELHTDIHTLAAGLAHVIFPQLAEEGDTSVRLTDEEVVAMRDAYDQLADAGLADERIQVNDEDDDDDEGDGESLFARKRKKKGLLGRGRALLGLKKKNAIQAARPLELSEVAIGRVWGGWAMPYIKAAFRGQTMAVPRNGLDRVTPQHNIFGFKAGAFAAFWEQFIQSLNSGSGRATKAFGRSIAVAGVDTVVTLTPTPYRAAFFTIRLSNSILANTNRQYRLRMFTQVGATELPYIVNSSPNKGVTELFGIGVENERGGGVPISYTDAEFRIPADDVEPGAVLTVESGNLRELEA